MVILKTTKNSKAMSDYGAKLEVPMFSFFQFPNQNVDIGVFPFQTFEERSNRRENFCFAVMRMI